MWSRLRRTDVAPDMAPIGDLANVGWWSSAIRGEAEPGRSRRRKGPMAHKIAVKISNVKWWEGAS